MSSKNEANYFYKVKVDGREVGRCQTHSKRLFYKRIGTIKWQNPHVSVHLRITYGKNVNVFNKITTFYNDGTYKNNEELMTALDAFTEDIR